MPRVKGGNVVNAGEARSGNTSDYWLARSGNGVNLATTLFPEVGQDYGFFQTNSATIWESFQDFPQTTVPAGKRVTWSAISGSWDTPYSGQINDRSFNCEYRYQTTVAWQSGDSLAAKEWLASFYVPAGTQSGYFISGSEALNNRVQQVTVGSLQTMAASDLTRVGSPPADQHNEFIRLADRDSYLEYGTLSNSMLNYTTNASVQLSDGTAVWLETTGSPTAPGISLRYQTRTSPATTVEALPVGNGSGQWSLPTAQQAITLVADPNDNLFIIGRDGPNANRVLIRAYGKQAGMSWLAKSFTYFDLPAYQNAGINNVAATWHPQNEGTIVIAASHAQGSGSVNQIALSAVNAQVALGTVAGNLVNQTTNPIDDNTNAKLTRYAYNPSGSCLAVTSLQSPSEGVMAVARGYNATTTQSGVELLRYSIASNGSFGAFASVVTAPYAMPSQPNDPDAYLSLSPLGAGFIFASAHRSDTSLEVYYWTYDGNGVNVGTWSWSYGQGSLRSNIAVIPDTQTAVLVWVDASRNLVIGDGSTIIASSVIPSGATVTSISLPHIVKDDRYFLARIAYVTGGGVHGMANVQVRVLDALPDAPSLIPLTVVNASTPTTFQWTFSDPNAKDSQSGYQLQIIDATTSTVVFDSGQVQSTASQHVLPAGVLSNGVNYQWRVRTYDQYNTTPGAYSAYSTFNTTAVGIVAITSPATDNAPGLNSSTLTVQWAFTSGGAATQAEYQVRVYRTDTNALIYDTGFVTGSGVTSHTIHGLLSDVEQRIEVTVKDTGAAVSGVGTRLVTPSFSSPKVPTITVTPNKEYVEVAVANPSNGLNETFPTVDRNIVYRRESPSGLWAEVGSAEINGVFRDYTAASGVLYDYYVAATSASGSTSSEIVTSVLTMFKGVWIHYPEDPQGTVRQYQFDEEGRTNKRGRTKTELRFVGRKFPVYDFGTSEDDIVSVTLSVPDDTPSGVEDMRQLRLMATNGKGIFYRDGKGRAIYGVVTDFGETDTYYGYSVSLTITRSEV